MRKRTRQSRRGWLVRASGAVYAFGDALYRGNAAATDIVGIAGTKDGQGYWVLGADGRVHAPWPAPWYGNATNCCGFPFSSIVAKRGFHVGYRMMSKNNTGFPSFEPNQAPTGDVNENSYMRVRGWAVDPNTTTRSIEVQIKVDGVVRYQQATPLPSQDVTDVFKISGNHRFDWTVPTWLHDALRHTVEVWALDSAGGPATLLNSTSWTSPNSLPVGALEEVSGNRIKGWVYDPNTAAPSTVRIYVSDAAGVFPATPTATVTANLPRGNPVTYNGFDWTVPSSFRDGKEHRVKIRALDYPTNAESSVGDPIATFIALADDWAGATAPSWDGNRWLTTATNSTRLVDILNNEGRLGVISSAARATANMPPVGDSDASFTYRFESNLIKSYLRPMLRASGASGAGQMQTGYRVEIRSDSTTIKLQSYVAGTSAPLGQFTYNPDGQPGPDPGNHRIRFQVVGGAIRVKVWPAGSTEPAGWQIDVPNDTTVTGTGVFQINHNFSDGPNTVFVDDLALSVPVRARIINCHVEFLGTKLVGDGRDAESTMGPVTCAEPVHADWSMGFNVRGAIGSEFVACQDSEPSAAAGYYSTNPMPRRTCRTRLGAGRNSTTHYLRFTAARDGNQVTFVNKDPSFYIDCPEGSGPCSEPQEP